MAYRRNYSWSHSYSYSSKTKVSVHWSAKSNSYMVNFHNIGNNFDKMQVLIGYMKNIPYGERDMQCDESSGKKVWTWYFIEKYLDGFKAMVDLMPTYFEWDFIGKPENQAFASKFISTDTYLDQFKNLTGQDVKGKEYKEAKNIYRRWIMQNHPDKGGDAKVASEVNETWSNLEISYFKTRKEVEYVT